MKESDFKQKILPLAERIYPMAARMLRNDQNAEDAVQEIMIKVWRSRSRLNNHPNPAGYVILIARNYCLDLLKKKNLKIYPIDQNNSIEAGYEEKSNLEREELFNIIEKMLEDLPEPQGESLKMRDIDGLNYDEIAGAFDLKVEHVRVILSRARKKVSDQLKNIYNYE